MRSSNRVAKFSNPADPPINYAILASKVPGVFNLGGDLSLFRNAILNHDRAQLEKYAEMCVDDLFPWNRNFDCRVTTIIISSGDGLRRWIEAALASSIIVAESPARWASQRYYSICSRNGRL